MGISFLGDEQEIKKMSVPKRINFIVSHSDDVISKIRKAMKS